MKLNRNIKATDTFRESRNELFRVNKKIFYLKLAKQITKDMRSFMKYL